MDPILLKILVAAVVAFVISAVIGKFLVPALRRWKACLLYTSPSPRDS